MRNKKLISMLMLSAGFVACTQEDIVDMPNVGGAAQKDLVEDVFFGVSLSEGEFTRSAYAGDKDGNVFKNFYLEPEVVSDAFVLSDNAGLHGDMIGFCLNVGGKAVTNYPFYIAGYGSAVDENPADPATYKNSVFGFSNSSALYNLGIDANTQVFEVTTPAAIQTSVAAVKAKGEKENLGADEMDVRKGIVRTHAGIMTGDYIAYYPYNAEFVDPAAVPAVGKEKLAAMYNSMVLKNDREGALEQVHFYDRLFAISRATATVSGESKAGDVSIVPMTSALTFQLTNKSTEAASAEIKRITIRSAQGENTFITAGTVSLDNLNTVTATESTDLIGIAFASHALPAATTLDDPATTAVDEYDGETKYLTIPYMADGNVKDFIVEIYTTDGKIATKTINTDALGVEIGLGKATLLKVNLATWKFEPGTRKVFTEEDFLAEVVSGGSLQMMADIEVNEAFVMAGNALDLNITGNKKLTLKAGAISKKITMSEGTLVLAGATVTGAVDVPVLNIDESTEFAAHVKATTVNVKAAKNATFKNATIATLNNKGTVVTNQVDDDPATEDVNEATTVSVTTLTNEGVLTVTNGLTVATLVNKGTVTVAKGLNVTSLTNDASKTVDVNGKIVATTIVNAGTFNVNAGADVNNATFNNNGTLAWAATDDMEMVINNNGTLTISSVCNFKGTLNNNKTVTISGTVEGVAGAVNNKVADAVITISDYVGFTTTKLNIEAGRVVVDGGDVNGNAQITIAQGAEFVVTADTENTLADALSSKSYNAKLTGIIVSAETWPADVTATAKKIYLRGNMTFAAATSLNAGLVVDGTSVVTATAGKLTVSDITINASKSLTVAANSNVDVTGKITNNGTYNQLTGAVVWCDGIAGNGTWTAKPKY